VAPVPPEVQPTPPDGSSHYFDTAPSTASRPGRVPLVLPDVDMELSTDRGVFSPGRVDLGTRVLLTEMTGVRLPDGGDLVDVGAGYGPIACTLALRHPDRSVWAVEINERARQLCSTNARDLGVGDRVHTVAPEEVPDDLLFAAVVSNPPIRVGKAALHDLLDHWLSRLAGDGEAWLVVQRNLGADSLARWLAEGGRVVEPVKSRKGYRVMAVRAGEPGPPSGAGGPAAG